MKRHPLSRKANQKQFTNTAKYVNSKNLPPVVMRGGIRL